MTRSRPIGLLAAAAVPLVTLAVAGCGSSDNTSTATVKPAGGSSATVSVASYADAIRAVFAVGGIAIAVGSLAGLFISESSGLFGFVEHGYRTPIALAIVAEVAATFFLVVFLAANGTGVQNIRTVSAT